MTMDAMQRNATQRNALNCDGVRLLGRAIEGTMGRISAHDWTGQNHRPVETSAHLPGGSTEQELSGLEAESSH